MPERIQNDNRHAAIVVLEFKPVSELLFALDRLAPPARAKLYTWSPIDSRMLDAMRHYVAGRLTTEPGASEAEQQVVRDYPAEQGGLVMPR